MVDFTAAPAPQAAPAPLENRARYEAHVARARRRAAERAALLAARKQLARAPETDAQ